MRTMIVTQYQRSKLLFSALLSSVLVTPNFALAVDTPSTYAELVDFFIGIINLLIPALFGLAFVYFIWKMIDAWIINAADERKRAEGRQFALVAVLMFVLMLSTWGIVTMLRNSIFGA